MKKLKYALALAMLGLAAAQAAESLPQRVWPGWRGPAETGSTGSGTYPASWSDGKNVRWKVTLPGIGCSTPAVSGEHIVLTAPIDGQDAVLDFDWEGRVRWQTKVGSERGGKHRNGSGSNPSPATDGQHIFVYYKSGNLAGLDFDGKLLWKTNLQDRFGKDTLYWDLGTSPVLTEKSVIVAVMQDHGSFLAAFDKLSGEMQWKVDRNYETPVEGDHSYATPHIVMQDGKQTIVVWGAEHLTAHSAEDGHVLWSCAGFNPDRKGNWVVVASAVIDGDMAIVPYGRGSHVAGVRLGGSGDVTETNRVWTRKDTGAFVPTPAVFGGKVYIVKDEGGVECLDSQTGKTLWTGQFPKNRNKYYSSPVVADGKLYAAREDGVVMVAKIDERFEMLSENDMGERVIASPVPVDSLLLIRGEQHLYCIGN